MSPRLGLVIAVLIALAYAALAGAPPHRPAVPQPTIEEDDPQRAEAEAVDSRPPPRSIDELRERIAAALAREHVAGATFALVDRSGPVFVGGVGVRDLATRAPMQPDTAFRVGSLSKSVVALNMIRLVDQGKLELDRPLRELLPTSRSITRGRRLPPSRSRSASSTRPGSTTCASTRSSPTTSTSPCATRSRSTRGRGTCAGDRARGTQ